MHIQKKNLGELLTEVVKPSLVHSAQSCDISGYKSCKESIQTASWLIGIGLRADTTSVSQQLINQGLISNSI